MDIAAPDHLNARKRPRQARSAVTVDAIFEATIQVLLADGIHRLTTTRVAQRAGVSVGTMYQYFTRTVQLSNGKFAVVEKSHEFTLVPWRPVIDRELDRRVIGVVQGGSVSWPLGGHRELGL